MTSHLETKNLVRELKDIFGPDDSGMIPASYVQQLLKLSWQEKLDNVGLRPLYWRVLLGLLSNKDKSMWTMQLSDMVTNYQRLKAELMPSIDKVDIDPLSALAMGDSHTGDLDRLYLTGIDDDYFQTPKRRDLVLAILFVWAQQHPIVSYRQGMHEIVGCLLYLVEGEAEYWERARAAGDIPASHPLHKAFSQQSVEAHTYAFFERIMLELECLYDPLPVAGADSQPFIVHFCAKIQEHYLRILDPLLSQHLEECFVQSQLYGLRWSRLLLGREFSATHTHLFRLWDFMFASCYEAENNTNSHQYEDEDTLPNVYSMFAYTRMNKLRKDMNASKRMHKDDKVTYACTPLLGALGDFMLAMLIQIRTELLESDSNSVIMYVMRYPQRDSVTQLIECADMIRRGVIVRDINADGAVLNYGQGPHAAFRDDQLARPTMVDFGKKVTDKLNVIKTAVGTGWNDIVQTIAAPLRESNLEDDPNKEHIQHIYRENAALDTSSDKIQYHSNSIYKTGITATAGGLQRTNSQSSQADNPLMDDAATVSTEEGSSVDRSSAQSEPVKETPKVEVKTVDPNIDPLSGMTTARTVPPTNLKKPAALSKPGEGTGYANMPESLMSPSLENNKPFAANTPTATSKSSGMSLFSPNWFPSSSTKSTKKKVDQSNRLSAGVNLQDLQQYSETANEYTKGSSSEATKDNAIGDRLLEIADHLAALSSFDNASGDDEDVCIATARRLRAIADVLGGYSSIVDFDMKFANKELPKTFPHVMKVKRGSNASISSLHSDASFGGSQATPDVTSDTFQMTTMEESPSSRLYLEEDLKEDKFPELSPTNVNEAPVSIDSPNPN